MFKTILRPAILYGNSIHTIKSIPLRLSACSYSSIHLDPYVNPRLSYAFGRGTAPLTNENINHFLDKLEQEPARDLLVSNAEDKVVSTQELVSDVRKLAAGLHSKLRLRRGDTICLWSLNCYDWLRIFYACQSLGITVCTVNPYYKEQELAYALTKCKAKALFMPGSESGQCKINRFVEIFNSDHVQTKLQQNGHVRSVVFIDENRLPTAFEFDTYRLEELNDNLVLDRQLLDIVQEDDPAVIMYTSGTTGTPKGVVLSNHNMINNGIIASNYVLSEGIDNAIVLPLPLFHSYALTCAGETMVLKGVKTILTGYRFDVKSVVESIIKYEGSMVMFTPTMIIDTVNYLKQNKLEVPTLRTIMTGAASFPPDLANTIKEVIPHLDDIRIGYGLTESSPVTTLCMPTDEKQYRLTTVGRPIEYVEVKVVDPQTEVTLAHNQEGELLIRGHNVMVQYFDDEERTKETLTPSRWLKTGDRATMDEKGFVKICGRTKEMIIKGGENIYPVEIENVLQGHANVLDAYCFGVPDKRLGQVVGCWVKLADPKVQTTAEEIQSYCKSLITSYKVPTYVMFVDSFPMTPTGKAKKFEMTRITCEKLGIEQ